MRRVDLLRGDRPWRVTLRVGDGLPGRERAAAALLVVVGLLGVLHPAAWRISALMAVLAAWGWWRSRRPEVWVTGGGRPPLSSTEWQEWIAHVELLHQEQEHDRKHAESKRRR